MHSSRNKVWEENTHWNTAESLKTALSTAGQEDFVPEMIVPGQVWNCQAGGVQGFWVFVAVAPGG